MSKQELYFYGQRFTGKGAEMQPTSIRLPVGFLQDVDTVCKYHDSPTGRKYSKVMRQDVPAMSRSEFISAALVNQLTSVLREDNGGFTLKLENPQQYKPATEETRAAIMKILSDVAALRIDDRAGFKTGINDLVNFLFERLCKENNGREYTGNYIYADEKSEMEKNYLENKKEGAE